MATNIKVKMEEWAELKAQLTEIRKDVKVLTTQEKKLKEEINDFMKKEEVDVVKLDGIGKISSKTRQSKGTFNRQAVRNGLHIFFGGDEAKIEGAMNTIEDGLEVKENSSVSLYPVKK